MILNLLKLISFLSIQIFYVSTAFGLIDPSIEEFLNNREKLWPDWRLTNLQSSNIKKDLIYPDWFEGDWLVKSEDLVNSSQKPIFYKVNFYKNRSGQVVGNRSKNAESIGKEIFGDKLIKVRTDPKSFNNQIIYLDDNQYIESRVTGRSQIYKDNLFFADEFFIQTAHKEGISRINQVEIVSKFFKCESDINQDDSSICGEQYTASYGSRVGNQNIESISKNKYKLTFTFVKN